jgi:hypothetical protein
VNAICCRSDTLVSVLFSLENGEDRGTLLDEYLETNQPRISAAGDVANYVDKLFDKRRSVEHSENAVSQGSLGKRSRADQAVSSRALCPFHPGSLNSGLNTCQCSSLVNCDVVGLLALYKVLRFAFRGVMHVAFEKNVGNNFLDDYAANSPCFGVPFNMVTALQRLSHRATILNEPHVVIQARK